MINLQRVNVKKFIFIMSCMIRLKSFLNEIFDENDE